MKTLNSIVTVSDPIYYTGDIDIEVSYVFDYEAIGPYAGNDFFASIVSFLIVNNAYFNSMEISELTKYFQRNIHLITDKLN